MNQMNQMNQMNKKNYVVCVYAYEAYINKNIDSYRRGFDGNYCVQYYMTPESPCRVENVGDWESFKRHVSKFFVNVRNTKKKDEIYKRFEDLIKKRSRFDVVIYGWQLLSVYNHSVSFYYHLMRVYDEYSGGSAGLNCHLHLVLKPGERKTIHVTNWFVFVEYFLQMSRYVEDHETQIMQLWVGAACTENDFLDRDCVYNFFDYNDQFNFDNEKDCDLFKQSILTSLLC
jgi:hypothetical protein